MPKSYADLLREARDQIKEVSADDIAALSPGAATVVDVREASEWEQGYIPGANHVSKSYIEQQIEAVAADRDAPVILYCAGGIRSLFAAQTLAEMGYTDVASMKGGFQAWKSSGREFATPVVLNAEQKQRYSRHLLIPEVGSAGQAKLLDSKALLIGAGGLGSPAALYLAAAGVGTIGLVDFDVVDISNLQRQIVHTTARVGERKVESAKIAINALNPDVNVVLHEEMLVASNVERIIAGYDVILDGTDTFETRYILNDAAVAAGCSVAGVLGVVPGILGLLQTNEALKVLLDMGNTLAGRLLLFDALETEFTELKLRRDPKCPVCSDEAKAARNAGTPIPVSTFGEGVFTLNAGGAAGAEAVATPLTVTPLGGAR